MYKAHNKILFILFLILFRTAGYFVAAFIFLFYNQNIFTLLYFHYTLNYATKYNCFIK